MSFYSTAPRRPTAPPTHKPYTPYKATAPAGQPLPHHSPAMRVYAMCLASGAEYGQVGYEACLAYALAHVGNADTVTDVWQSKGRLYVASEVGKVGQQTESPARRGMYTELLRGAWMHTTVIDVAEYLRDRGNALVRAKTHARLKHNLAPMYLHLASDALAIRRAWSDIVPGRMATIVAWYDIRQAERLERKTTRDKWHRIQGQPTVHTSKQRHTR